MRLLNKVAIITGAARGIGRETARILAREGAKVVVCDFDEQFGVMTADEIVANGGEAIFYKVNVADLTQVEAMVQTAIDKFGRIDILINNAGITRDGFLTKMSPENWDAVISVNLTGVFNCAKAVVPHMMNQGSGRIINTSSVVGVYGNMGQTNYAATKAGVIGLTKSWAKEFGKKGINVNAVAPGFIITDMTSKMPEKILDQMKEKTPLGRLGQPRDIANAYLFLASDEAAYVNGMVLNVDGGLVL